MRHIYLRATVPEDSEILFEWINDKICRENSFNQGLVEWTEHRAWFDNILCLDNVWLYIVMCDNKPVGQIRLELDKEIGTLSYSVSPKYRGLGLGKVSIQLLEQEILQSINECLIILAKVKLHNRISQCIFESMGYQRSQNDRCITYLKRRENILEAKNIDNAFYKRIPSLMKDEKEL